MLEVACEWAHKLDDAEEAVEELTKELWTRGLYDQDEWYTRDSSNQQTFYLKAFLSDNAMPRGDCRDFANFLLCMNSALGALDLKVQRSNPNDGQSWFLTNTIHAAGGSPDSTEWAYHQFVIRSQDQNFSVWDGSLEFASPTQPSGFIISMSRETYRGEQQNAGLIYRYVYGQWAPSPTAGFHPTLDVGSPPQ